MRYNGGKGACAKEIAQIINTYKPARYWEPFVGAANVITKVNAQVRIGSDLDFSILTLLNSVKKGWSSPTKVTEEDYKNGRNIPIDNPLHAFLKFGCSFGGKPWGGFARSGDRNYALNAHRSLEKIRPLLQDIELIWADYQQLDIVADVIYCDPPYKGTTSVGCNSKFDTNKFLDWCDQKARTGSAILVSELDLPNTNWDCVWEKQLNDGLGQRKIKERLFKHK